MLNARLDALTAYPFARLRALLEGVAPPADLKPIILSVGEPRHPPPDLVCAIVSEHAAQWGRYPPIEGTADFRNAVADWLTRRYRLPSHLIDADDQILPVAGSREALYLVAALAVCERDDGRSAPLVLMPNPFYQVYQGAAVMHGGAPVYLPAGRGTGFLPDLDAIAAPLLERTALMYLCSPANPQGAVADLGYLRRAVTLAREHDFALVVDECYAEIYDRAPPAGALEACVGLGGDFANVLVFHSLSKRSSVPGLRSGFVAGDATLIAAFRRLRIFGGASVGLPVLAASAALWREEAHVEENRRLYRAKLDLAERLIGGRFAFYRPAGGFFLWLDVGDGERAALDLWRRAALRVLPGAYLGQTDGGGLNPGAAYIRVALIESLAVTEDALRRLLNVL
jgi:N-succinyldiaminopimelate aminotransferase